MLAAIASYRLVEHKGVPVGPERAERCYALTDRRGAKQDLDSEWTPGAVFWMGNAPTSGPDT